MAMITVRLSRDQHDKVVKQSNAAKASLNAFCVAKLLDEPVKQLGKPRGKRATVVPPKEAPDSTPDSQPKLAS